MRAYHRQAWMSVGRAFRFLQGMGFHEIDSLDNNKRPPTGIADNFIETEEKRRVFWMAYLLNHLFSIRNDWPITLTEHVVSIPIGRGVQTMVLTNHICSLSDLHPPSVTGHGVPERPVCTRELFIRSYGRALLESPISVH
jgi:hypothetical protein